HIYAENIASDSDRLTVTLPVVERPEVAEAAPSPVAPATRCARVLIVDDEDQLRKLVTEVVIGLGHQVEETPSGQDAVARLASHEYDVILLDVRLPDLDGEAIWRRLRVDRQALSLSPTADITADAFSQSSKVGVTTRPVRSIGWMNSLSRLGVRRSCAFTDSS